MRVFTLAYDCQHKTFRHAHRHIFERMHGKIGATVCQRGLQLLDKQAFTANF